jgi:hypothetical protein
MSSMTALKVMIAELLAGSSEFYDAKMKVLSEEIKHHLKEEEKAGEGIFAQARKGELDLNRLGEQLLAEKEALLTKFKADMCRRRSRAPSPVTS